MRGKVFIFAMFGGGGRITPAHAGKRLEVMAKRNDWGDHPRPCGEKCLRSTSMTQWRGSPPPMRGKGIRAEMKLEDSRITPAHAGKSLRAQLKKQSREDHPRPCGEKYPTCKIMRCTTGSPPPMRGKATLFGVGLFAPRITPAHAGKSRMRGTWPIRR